MGLAGAIHELKPLAEFGVQTGGAVPCDGKPAALLGAIQRKGGDNDMPAYPHRLPHRFNVTLPVAGMGQEMKDCAIVPDSIGMARQSGLGNVGLDPGNVVGLRAKPLAGELQRLG